jgi:hypothetical protein
MISLGAGPLLQLRSSPKTEEKIGVTVPKDPQEVPDISTQTELIRMVPEWPKDH